MSTTPEQDAHLARLLRMAMIENMVTLAATAATVVGLYWAGAGNHAFWGLIMLLNINHPRPAK